MDYFRRNKVDVRIVRIFNTYGPGMHPFDGRVVSNFIRQALVGENITVFGDGSQSRSFCYRDDLVDEMTGSKSKIVQRPLPVDDPIRRQPDITLARKHLGWEPTVKLREGLQKTIDWFRMIRMDEFRAPTPHYS
jgi:UDP-glucuronate decarboxylase